MELTGKQKRYLKSAAHHLTPIFQVGKAGVNDDMLKNIDEALVKRELFKISLLQNTALTTDEVAEIITKEIDATVVQKIGRVLVLFKVSPQEKFRKISNEIKNL
ncbi:ribosome assembly RNA-binding protein YhbY [Enterococcus timonensis]|uniref:ribosome assembly RNA-binding protein YhbY n=1 Tax=Enterococcus timonensis TaxID=1852364 RepID=UPI0008DAFE6C|nr:ribosome assembly RNA-binding protein YhbY [Enterococcus timonensis]